MDCPRNASTVCAALLVWAFLPAVALAAYQTPMPEEGLFDSEAVLELTIDGDLRPIFKDRSDDRPYRPARLWYLDQPGDTVSFDMGIKTRGFYRRKYLDCDVPPLRLNFKKKQVKNTVFAGQDKLKLVTHKKIKSTSSSNTRCKST